MTMDMGDTRGRAASTMRATPVAPAPPRALPGGVYLLGFSLFAMGSAEFLLAGVLPALARDVGVSLLAGGALITAFAVGVVVGGPPFALVSLAWPRRTALVVSQLVFAGAIASSLVVDYWAMILARFVAGLAYAGFFAVAAATAVSLVAPERTARASAVVVSGLSVAMVAGGPAGTLLGNFLGWRAGFWAVVVLTASAALACTVVLPNTSAGAVPSRRRELRALRHPQLWLVNVATILTTAAYMLTYNYLASLLIDVTGLPDVLVSPVLVAFGVGAFVGLSLGGRWSDRAPHHALLLGSAGITTTSVLLAVLAESAVAVVPLVVALGIAGFVLNPAIYALAPSAPTLAGAVTVSSFQLGISLTPAIASLVLNSAHELRHLPLAGALLATTALAVIGAERSLALRGRRRSGNQ